ncbi:hypothetical protein IZY60_03950 [Lutibacter sp. B2]|nr:hypothetical protein [Lutibacter sp. B2]
MLQLNIIHYVYAITILIIVLFMIMKKDIVLPSMIGLFVMGTIYSGSILKGIQTIYNGVIVSGTEFWNIIVIISFIIAMSKGLQDIGADVIIINPINKFIKNTNSAFWMLGIVMMFTSFILWPSPAVALVGAILLPAAIKADLPRIWAAVAMNIFGNGIALSGDFFIQGAPGITAKAAGLNNSFDIMKAQVPLWLTMSIVTSVTSFFMMKYDLKKRSFENTEFDKNTEEHNENVKLSFRAKGIAFFTLFVFAMNIFSMYKNELRGGDAAALISGTSVIILTIAVIAKDGFKNLFENMGIYIKDGFLFGIKTFAPVLIIGAFFFLGNEETAKKILGSEARGYLSDIGLFLSNKVALSKAPVIIMQTIISGISGLGGSGFSALPLVGTLSSTFSSLVEINKAGLAALGQLVAIWVGGGTIIPWGVIPIAAICNVSPLELVKKNLLPVLIGMIATVIVAMFIL